MKPKNFLAALSIVGGLLFFKEIDNCAFLITKVVLILITVVAFWLGFNWLKDHNH